MSFDEVPTWPKWEVLLAELEEARQEIEHLKGIIAALVREERKRAPELHT